MTNKSIRCLLVFAVLVLMVGQFSYAQSGASGDQRHIAYLGLNRQIYTRHGDAGSGDLRSSGKLAGIDDQLQRMIEDDIVGALNGTNPSEVNVTSSITKLQGDITFSAWGAETTNAPYTRLFELGGIQSAAVGYVILEGGDAIPDTQCFLQFFDKSSGAWERKAAAPTASSFQNHGFIISQVNSGIPSEAWFLVWGQVLGSSHATRDVYLYAFDGLTVRTVWKRLDLEGGQVTVQGRSVTLDYREAVGTMQQEEHEVLKVTADGLTTVSLTSSSPE